MLHLVKQRVAQVAGESHRADGRGPGRSRAETQGQESHQHHLPAQLQQLGHVDGRFIRLGDHIDQLSDQLRDEGFHHHLADDQDRGQEQIDPVPARIVKQFSQTPVPLCYQKDRPLCRGRSEQFDIFDYNT